MLADFEEKAANHPLSESARSRSNNEALGECGAADSACDGTKADIHSFIERAVRPRPSANPKPPSDRENIRGEERKGTENTKTLSTRCRLT
jgi:hypothetical protein